MRKLCLWCGQALAFVCPACGEPLQKLMHEGTYILACQSGPTPIYFTNPLAIQTVPAICKDCLRQNGKDSELGEENKLSAEDRLNLAAYLQHLTPPAKKGSHGGTTKGNTPQIGDREKERP